MRGWWNRWVPNIQLKSNESYWELITDVLVSKYFQIYENKFNLKKLSFDFLFKFLFSIFFTRILYIYIDTHTYMVGIIKEVEEEEGYVENILYFY